MREVRREMAQMDTILRALINKPCVISTTTLQEMGVLANRMQKVDMSLGQEHWFAWDSPIWAHVTNPSTQLLKADKGQQKVIVGPWPKHDHMIYYPRFGPS